MPASRDDTQWDAFISHGEPIAHRPRELQEVGEEGAGARIAWTDECRIACKRFHEISSRRIGEIEPPRHGVPGDLALRMGQLGDSDHSPAVDETVHIVCNRIRHDLPHSKRQAAAVCAHNIPTPRPSVKMDRFIEHAPVSALKICTMSLQTKKDVRQLYEMNPIWI
jgi:hypothetical protein